MDSETQELSCRIFAQQALFGEDDSSEGFILFGDTLEMVGMNS